MIRVLPSVTHLKARALDDGALEVLRDWFQDAELERWLGHFDDVRFSYQQRTQSRFWALMFDDGTPVGYIKTSPDKFEPAALLIEFAVCPDLRGRGYGTQLLEWIKNAANQLGFLKLLAIVHEDNTRCLRCLSRNGFVEFEPVNRYGYSTMVRDVSDSHGAV